MVHSEHDSHFFALNKQLNDEAMSLDWTRSTGHTLTSRKNISSYDEDEEEDLSYEPNNIKISNRVGGEINAFASPRASSISAAYKRLINTSTNHEKFEPDPDETNKPNLDETSNIEVIVMAEPDPDESVTDITNEDEMLRSDPEIERVEEAGVAICSKIQKTVRMLRSQVTSEEASSVLQTLFKIIKNVIEHPNETKFRRLRKANPHFQRNVANYANAMEVLKMVGFMEDVADEVGRVETYVVLKRNDPGLLWLAKSSLEVSMS